MSRTSSHPKLGIYKERRNDNSTHTNNITVPIKSSRISNLPGELVLRIFHYLDAPASTCLGLTCTTFYAIHLSQHHRRTSLLDYVWYPSQGRFGQQWQLIQFYQLLEDWMEGVQGKKLVFNRHLELFIDKWVWGKGCEDISRVDYGRLKDLRPARYESLIPIIISIIKKWWG